jgi:hypothetical protein
VRTIVRWINAHCRPHPQVRVVPLPADQTTYRGYIGVHPRTPREARQARDNRWLLPALADHQRSATPRLDAVIVDTADLRAWARARLRPR